MKMRIIHRYLGFFLAGIMAVYAISGVVLIFRSTDFLKREIAVEKQIASNLTSEQLPEAMKMRRLKVEGIEGKILHFQNGRYDQVSGIANYTKKELPYVLDRMTHLHKANTNHPLFILNIFFGLGLLFFVISSFWMFMPSSSVFKKGMYFTLGGVVLTLVLVFV